MGIPGEGEFQKAGKKIYNREVCIFKTVSLKINAWSKGERLKLHFTPRRLGYPELLGANFSMSS